jgi:hypothetical protein
LSSDHRRHDRLLVARLAAGDSYPSEAAAAESLVAGCSECAELAADIRLLSRRTGELRTPRRPRDFRISAEQADRLRGSWFERLMRGIAAPGWGTVLRPVAGAAFALGLMLMVVGALPFGAAAPTDQRAPLSDSPIQMFASEAPAAVAPMATADDGSISAPGGPEDMAATADIAMEAGRDADPDDINQVYLQSPDPAAVAGEGFGSADAGRISQSNVSVLGVGVMVALFGAVVLGIAMFARRRYGDALIR